MSIDLRINCLGNLQIRLGDKNISPFETDKAKALLVYLAIESDQKLQRPQLAGFLWPDETEERALHNLRQTLSSLRKTLDKTIPNSELLVADRKTIALAPDINIQVDSLEFRKLFQAALKHYQEQSGRGLIHIRFLKRSLDLVQGEFLANFSISKSILFEEWGSFQREELNLMAVRGFNLLAVYHELRGENHHAIKYVSKIVELCPWDESAQNHLIRLLAISGQWTAAKMQFAAMQRYLKNELSVTPAQDSIQLYEQVCLAAEGNATIEAEHKPNPSQLPISHAAFIGREKEQDEIMTWLTNPQTRLVTLTGLGGIGKTHLALQITRQFAGIFQHGVYFAPLISVKDTSQLIPQIADAIGFNFTGQAPNEKQLIEHLREKNSLLMLDNFEHLLKDEKCVQFLDTLLNTSRHLKLLVTSRERLNLVQEQVYLLSGLPYPQNDDISTTQIQAYESIELFLHRTTQKLPQFTLNEHNAHSIIRICHILEGLPLGVELAAATVCEQNCNQIDETYVDNLGALATQMNNFTTRHRNLNAAFELSWELLTPQLKACLYKLSFFLDSFSAHAALQIADAATKDLTTLVSKSLLRIDENGRYSLHEAIRQFTGRKALPDIDSDLLMEKHAAYYTEFLHSLTNDLLEGGQTKALNAISLEFGNLSLCCNWVRPNTAGLTLYVKAWTAFTTITTSEVNLKKVSPGLGAQ